MDFGLVAGGLLKVALPKVAGAIATAVKDKLHLSELQRSLTVALQKSGAFERGQKANNAVFYRCTDKEADTFLIALLEHPEVQHELQKPLEQDGTLDVEILVQAARHVATTQNLAIATAPLEVWLKAFANAYFDAITAIRFQVAKADYLEQLANWFDDVKFAGVAVPGQDVERAERLAQIFVMPDVEEDGGVRSRVAFERSLFEEQGEQGRQGELLQEQRMRAQLERSGRKFSARQLLNQHQKKIVLLGAPGSGKTTLMSFFAVELAEKGAERQGAIAPTSDVHAEGLSPHTMALSGETKGLLAETKGLLAETKGLRPNTMALSGETIALSGDTEGLLGNTIELSGDTEGLLPILIRIRDWARTPDVTIPEYARQFAETTMSCKPLPKGFFEHWLNNGRALILLDGLDEVAEEAKRYHLVQCIENFLGQYPQNRAIITSRPAGYKRDFFRTEEFPHYELQPFDDGKIEEFCDRWYTSRVPDAAEAQRRKESLQKALNQQDRIKLLARNPLLLTIIALIHRYQARLPRERYKLYDKAVETLLTAWDDNKELSNQTVLQYLQLDDLRRLMESLAYWIHTQGNTGDREGGTLIDKDELIQKLCQEIKTLKQLQHYEAKAEADRFVKFIRDRTGLLNEQGQDCYAFVHKTFQEYLAAQDINYQADNEDDFEIVLTHIEQHLHDPHWREVLLLLIAQQSPKKAARAIRKVLSANSPYEQWLHRDLLFAARCLTEETKGLNEVDAKLVLTLLKELVELEGSHSKFAAEKLRKQVFQILCNLNTTVYQSQALDLLRTSAQKINKARLRRYQVVLGDAQAATALPLTLLQDKDSLVRSHASTELGNLGISSDVVVQGLLALLHDENSLVRSCAIAALSDLRNGSAAVERGLLALLKDDLPSVRSTAARVLGNLGIASDDVVQGLLTLLKDESSLVICSATEALGRLRNDSDAVVQELLASLKDANSEVRSNAAEELSNLGIASNAVVQGLLTLLKDAEPSVRSSAVGALDELGAVSDGVAQELLRLLKDNESSVRFSVAVALSKLGAASDDVVQGLLASLKDTSYGGRFSAAYALGELGNTSDAVMQGLLTSLKDANSEADSEVRARVAEAFGKLGNASNTVVQTLLALLQDKDSDVRARVVDALGELGTTSDAVVQGLLKSLRDKNSGVYYRSAEALGKLGIASDAVVQELLVVLQDENSHARSRVATVLGELAKRSNQVEPAIVQWIEQHQNEDCVGAGIDALWEIVEGEG